MTDLLDLLGLPPEPIKRQSSASRKPTSVKEYLGNEKLRPSKYALEVDAYDIAMGESLAEHPGKADAMTDFRALVYGSKPQLNEAVCNDPNRKRFIETLIDSPDFQNIRKDTIYDAVASDLAAKNLASQFFVENPNDKKSAMRCANNAIKSTENELDEFEDMMQALGEGCGSEEAKHSTMNVEEVTKTFRRVQNSWRLREIIKLAGKYRRVARSKQRQKTIHGYDDMVGVELSGDVSRLLPSELAMLADEDFELDAMRRLVENQSMSRQYRGIESKQMGPVVLCGDESSSMDGERLQHMKAIALTMVWIAQHQRRQVMLVSFAHTGVGHYLTIKPGQSKSKELLDWVSHFYDGGTDYDYPLHTIPQQHWHEMPQGKTDMIFLTDGICSMSDELVRSFNAWKATNKVKMLSIVVGSYSAGQLPDVSDEVFMCSRLRVDELAIERCFSI